MVAKGLVCVVQHDLALAGMLDYTGLEIVAYGPFGNAAKEFVHVDVATEPCALLAVQAGFHIGILAVGQRADEKINLGNAPGCMVDQAHGLSAPVHLARIARTMFQMIGQVVGTGVFVIAQAEFCVAEAELLGSPARSLVFLPKGFQRDADPLQFLVDVSVVRLPIDDFVGVLVWIKAAVRFLVRQLRHVAERNVSFLGDAQHVVDGTLRDMVEPGDGVLRHARLCQSQDQFDPDFLAHGNVSSH